MGQCGEPERKRLERAGHLLFDLGLGLSELVIALSKPADKLNDKDKNALQWGLDYLNKAKEGCKTFLGPSLTAGTYDSENHEAFMYAQRFFGRANYSHVLQNIDEMKGALEKVVSGETPDDYWKEQTQKFVDYNLRETLKEHSELMDHY